MATATTILRWSSNQEGRRGTTERVLWSTPTTGSISFAMSVWRTFAMVWPASPVAAVSHKLANMKRAKRVTLAC